jgi:hypothetical protein
MSATPSSNADSNFSVFDLDVVGLQLDREVELVLPRPYVVLPAVPRAAEHAPFESALAERAPEMQAVSLHGIEAAVAVRKSDFGLSRGDRSDRSRWNVLHASDGDEAVFHRPTLARGLE